MNLIETEDGYIARDQIVRVIAGHEHDEVEYRGIDGSVRTSRLVAPLDALLGHTIVVAVGGYRVVQVRFADLAGEPVVRATPVVAWKVPHATGIAEPITQHLESFDPSAAECCIESNGAMAVVSGGIEYPSLGAFVAARRTTLQEAQARRAAEAAANAARRAARVQGAAP